MAKCKKDITSLLMHRGYVVLALIYLYIKKYNDNDNLYLKG